MREARYGVRLFHLTENLRLADDQRIEAGGDAEQVPRRLGVVEGEEVRLERLPGQLVVLAQEVDQLLAGLQRVAAGDANSFEPEVEC